MAIFPVSSNADGHVRKHIESRARLIYLLVLVVVLGLCIAFSWTTRDAMTHLPFLTGQGKVPSLSESQKTLVDLRPWQTAETLASLAVTAEEADFAHEAERLADHEVDQAFASALRQASGQVQNRTLTGEALALSQSVAQIEQLVKEDQALVGSLTPKSTSPAGPAKEGAQPVANDDDLEIAKAQLGLDSDQLTETQQELDRVTGDNRTQIQGELTAHEAAMKKYDSEVHSRGQVAILSATQQVTLAGLLKAWNSQSSRYQLIQQAMRQAQADITSLTAGHNALEAKANASAAAIGTNSLDHAARLASINERTEERQLLSILNDRIQTQQQLAAVYGKWAAQVSLQHRISLHLMLQLAALIVLILISILLVDALVRRLTENPALDRRRMQTLRTILQLGVQVLGILLILFVVFGLPRQTSTILGLATAGFTIALQDFILAFFGWFVLMGKNGIRVGDWVEINGVGGEVTDIGLFSTTLLETGTSTETGGPTGRRITFINSFAIRGQYFNFSTTGQWMWDEITVSIPASVDMQAMVEGINKAVLEETEKDAHIAEHEWKRGTRDDGLSRFSAAPVVNQRPTVSGIDIQIRYVTRASERFEVRNRLYQHMIALLHTPDSAAQTKEGKQVAGV